MAARPRPLERGDCTQSRITLQQTPAAGMKHRGTLGAPGEVVSDQGAGGTGLPATEGAPVAGAPRCGSEAHAPERALEEARRSREEAERAADRLRGLQRATAALSTTLSRSEIARAIAEHGLRLFGAMAGGISCLCADGRLEKLLAFGGPEQSLDEYWRPSLNAGMPHREALRTLQPIWLESPQQIEARYPHLEGLRARLGVQAWAVVPFVVQERAVGALGLRFSEAHRFEPDEREFLLSLANACAQALERARLFEEKERLYQQSEALLARERVARHEAEAASRALQVERAHLQSVIDQLPAAVVIADRTGKIVAGNSALERDIRSPIVYPLSLEDFGRGGSWRCTHPDGRPTQPQDRPLARALTTGEVVMGEEFVIFRGDGTRATMSLGAAPIRGVDGEIEGAVGMSWDMSEQKAVEEALREATRALDEANRHKDQFLAMLAHELRNPLAAIANATHVMKVRLARGQAVEEPFAILERQVKNSSRLLDDLLDVARLTHGLIQLSKERIRIDAVVTNAVDAQRALIGSRGHELTVSLPDEPLYVEGDPTRLEQVVTNLLNNAAKYTPDRGRIAVRAERAGGEVVVRVRDNGLGISRELMPRLFALFVQADSSLARTQGGLGLGLTLVHDLVAMHGGTVEAASEGPDKGSEFTVRLPLLAEPGDPVHETTQPEPPAAHVPRRILVVEDNIDTARMLREILSGAGHDVEFPNRDGRLRPGMFANVDVLSSERQPVLIIPATAVIFAPYGDSVFAVEEKKDGAGKTSTVVRQKFVRTAERRGDLIAVASGLSAGQRVVTSGAFKLRNGTAVAVNDALAPKAQLAPKPTED